MELKRKELQTSGEDPKRQAELSAYFTHCNLQPAHLVLSLRSAMNNAFTKMKNYKDAGIFARRLLELNPSSTVEAQCKKVIDFSNNNPENTQSIDYDARNPFVICAATFVPVYKGSPSVQCPYCEAYYHPDHSGSLCNICQLSQVAKKCSPRKF